MILEKAKAIIEDPKNWCQHVFASDLEGKEVLELEDTAYRWCAVGAFIRANGSYTYSCDSEVEFECLDSAAGKIISYYVSKITYVNDNLGHAAVMKMYDLAIKIRDEKCKLT